MARVVADDRSKSIFWISEGKEKKIATINLTPGRTYYGERTVQVRETEYRFWDPFRSKLAAALINGLKYFPFQEGARILYLGASTGTTVSHVSDIVGEEGIVFAVEFAPRVANEFIDRCANFRRNIVTIVEDARRPERYSGIFGRVDTIYCDIAQPDQTQIAIKNSMLYLKKCGYLLLIVKSRSIDSSKPPSKVFEEEESKLRESRFEILQSIVLSPFDKDHAMIVSRSS
ncbi:MAG: fibrillarin-like rRNA/tRNA 2'-O-methyltransferase [Nitrososphaeria archaeon]